MRILAVSQSYYPYLAYGGPPAKVRAIAKALGQRGHRITVLTAHLGPLTSNERLRMIRSTPWGWRADDDPVEAIYLETVIRYRALTVNPSVLSFCDERLREFDVVHIYGLYDLLGAVVAFFCRRQGIPYLVEPMGMFRPIVRSIWRKRLYHALLGRKLVNGARLLIATSEGERRQLTESGVPTQKVVVRRNGVEIPERLPPRGSFRQRCGIRPETKVVLFLGRIVSKKGPELLLEAFGAILRSDDNLKNTGLVIAGPEEGDGYLQRLEFLVRKLRLMGRVLFTGPLYGDAKWAAYRDADLFVLPSQNENFGNSAGEAAACGTPVIVTDQCGIAPLLRGRAGVVVPYDRKALQSALTELLCDDDLRKKLGRGCQTIASELSWEEPTTRMEAVYHSLAAGRSLEMSQATPAKAT